MKILLIEDKISDTEAFEELCKNVSGEIVLEKCSLLSKAYDLCKEVDVIVIDLNLINSTKEEILQFIKEHRRGTPTIVHSTTSDPAIISYVSRLGAGYLIKGMYHPKELLVEIYKVDGRIKEWNDLKGVYDDLVEVLYKFQSKFEEYEKGFTKDDFPKKPLEGAA